MIVIPFSLLDLSEQAIIQMILGFLRFFTMGAIVVYSIVRLAQDGNACIAVDLFGNSSLEVQDEIPIYNISINSSLLTNVTDYYHRSEFLFGFDVNGWLVAIPVFTYAFIIHQGIPALTHPIKQKAYLRWLMVAMFSISAFSYLSLGLTASLWFSGSVQETVTLNWVRSLVAQAGN